MPATISVLFISYEFISETEVGQRVASLLHRTLVQPGYTNAEHALVLAWYFALILYSPLRVSDIAGA